MDIERVVIRLAADATRYHMVMNSVERSLHNFSRQNSLIASAMARSFTVFNRALAVTTLAIGGASYVAIKLAADLQKTEVAFRVMTGSAEKAKELIREINQLAIDTPFRSPELMGAAKQLKAFGVEASQIMPTLKVLGEVSSGTNTSLERLILAFGQIRVAGRLMGPEARQLINAGVPMYDYLSKVTGHPVTAMKGLIEDAKINFPMVAEAFNMMTQEGGLFFNMMEEQSQTVAGRWSAFVETLEIGLRDTALAFFEAFGIRDWLDRWRQSADDLRGQHEKMIATFTRWRVVLLDIWVVIKSGYAIILGMINWVIDLVKAIWEFSTGATFAAKAIRSFVAALLTVLIVRRLILTIKDLVLSVYMFIAAISLAKLMLIGIPVIILTIIGALGGFDGMLDTLGAGFKEIGEVFSTTWEGIKEAVETGDFEKAFKIAFKGIEVAWLTLVGMMKGVWFDFIYGIGEVALKLPKFLGDVAIDVAEQARLLLDPTSDVKIREQMNAERAKLDASYKAAVDAHRARRDIAKEGLIKETAGPAKVELMRLLGKGVKGPLPEVTLEQELESLEQFRIPAKAVMQHLRKLEEESKTIGVDDFKRLEAKLGPEKFSAMSDEAIIKLAMKEKPGSGVGFGKAVMLMMESQRSNFIVDKARQEMIDKFRARGVDVSGAPTTGAGIRKDFLGRYPSQVTEMAGDIRREMGKELDQGIGSIGGRMSHFAKQMNVLEEAFRGPHGAGRDAMAAIVGAPGVYNPPMTGVLNQKEYEFGLLQQLKSLRKFTGADEEVFPRAMYKGTTEAQDTINRQNKQQISVLEEIRDLFKIADERDEQISRETNETLKALKTVLQERRVVKGGFGDGS